MITLLFIGLVVFSEGVNQFIEGNGACNGNFKWNIQVEG